MDACQFYLFGPPHVVCGAEPIAISRRKQWGLLAYLLLTQQPHERDTLAALLWPTYSQSHARADLRRELARLRRVLPDVIACSNTEVVLQTGAPLWVDVWAFEEHLAATKTHAHSPGAYCAACHEHLRAAWALYTDDLLAGYALAGSPGFEEWHFFQQESLRSELLDVLSKLAAMEMADNNLPQAIAPLRARLAIDPLHEESHRQLIWLYIHTGQRAAALRQFGECREVLARELGAEPAPETVVLYQQVKSWAGAPPALPSVSSAEAMPCVILDRPHAEPSGRGFAGRQRQLAELGAHLDGACTGHGCVAFVSGEAGAGKTALLNEFGCRALAKHADLVVAAGCGTVPYTEGAPLLPFRSVIAMLAGDSACEGAEWQPAQEQVMRLRALFPRVLHTLVAAGPHLVGSLVPGNRLLTAARATYGADTDDYARLCSLVAASVDIPAGSDLHHLVFAETAAVLEELAQYQPLLLLLDNFHWADAASLNLLFHLGKRVRSRAMMIVCAYRPDEIAADDSTRTHSNGLPAANWPLGFGVLPTCHPLQALIHEFMRDFGPVQIDLDGEVQAEDLAWVDALLAAESCPPAVRDALFARTHGQPLYTSELLEAWRTQGLLAYAGDSAGLEQHRQELDVVPPRTAAAIQRRIDRLSDDGVRVITVASVKGETFSLGALAEALNWSERRTLEIVAGELHHRRHLVVEAEPTAVTESRAAAGSARGTEESTGSESSAIFYRFANPMIRSYLYRWLDTGERLVLAGSIRAPGTPLGTLEGRMQPTLKAGRVDGQAPLMQSNQPFCPLAVIAPSQRSVPMYHRWHFNYPILILILAILLAVWAVSYTVATMPGFNISGLWQQAPKAELVSRTNMVEVGPGVYVPRDYYLQEKMYREPVILVLAPGFKIPQDYFIQEKTHREPALVTLAPGYNVPLGYYIQEKTYREPAFVEVAPGFKVPQDYYVQEKMYREEAAQ